MTCSCPPYYWTWYPGRGYVKCDKCHRLQSHMDVPDHEMEFARDVGRLFQPHGPDVDFNASCYAEIGVVERWREIGWWRG